MSSAPNTEAERGVTPIVFLRDCYVHRGVRASAAGSLFMATACNVCLNTERGRLSRVAHAVDMDDLPKRKSLPDWSGEDCASNKTSKRRNGRGLSRETCLKAERRKEA